MTSTSPIGKTLQAIALSASLALSSAPSQAAYLLTTAYAGTHNGPESNVGTGSATATSAYSRDDTISTSVHGGLMEGAAASARADFGQLGVSAATAAAGWGSGTGYSASAGVESSAAFSDTLTVYSDALNGQRGLLSSSMILDGAVVASDTLLSDGLASRGMVRSFYQITLHGTGLQYVATGCDWNLGGFPFCDYSFWQTDSYTGWDGSPTSSSFVDPAEHADALGGFHVTVPVSIEFVFGSPISLYYAMSATVSASAGGGGHIVGYDMDGNAITSSGYGGTTIDADFFHTSLWGGIGSIEDQFGNTLALDQLTFQSESGFNYRYVAVSTGTSEIPEPESLLLCALALATLGIFWRRDGNVTIWHSGN